MTNIDLRSVHVDRDQEIVLFRKMILGSVRAHILLVQAEGGMGKSSLLREFWNACRDRPRAQVNLKQMTYSVGEILGELCHQLGPEHFENFYRQCEEFARSAGFAIDHSTLIGTKIDASLGGLTPQQRSMHRQMLTDSFFHDLGSINAQNQRLVVILFDSFEHASDEVKEWLGGLFLTRLRPCRWLVLVLAGRVIPDLDVGWEEWCLKQSLRPLDRDNVREYIRRIQLSLSEDEIGILYDITDGRPLELATHLGTLLLKRGGKR